MCFGDSKVVDTKTSTANPAVASAATSNLDYATGLRDKGFTGYDGQQVADFSPDQQNSFGLTNAIVGNGTAPKAENLIDRYTGTGPQSVEAGKISDNMSPYMNQYVMKALAPQLHQMDLSQDADNARVNATATGAGAFGDARAGIEAANTNFGHNVEREGVIGNAYQNAFNTAIGAGAQDVSNKLGADSTTGNFMEQYLQRALGGSSAVQGLQNQQLGVAGVKNTMGQQQTAKSQAGLTAAYNQWLMSQQYPFQTTGLVNQTVAAGANAMPATVTESKPDNSGYGILGSVLGTAADAAPALMMMSDVRLKDDISHVGELKDGTPVFSYHYKADPLKRKQIGLMAQDVATRRPDAVAEFDDSGFLAVDYGKATERSRLMSMNI